MTQREARQIANKIAGLLCQQEADSLSMLGVDIITKAGYLATTEQQARVKAELAGIARRLTYNGRRVRA